MRMFTAAALVAAAMLSTAGPASAFGKRCGTCSTNDRGGPLRNLIGGVVDRVHDRQEARQAARGCQSHAEAFPAPAAPAGVPGPVTYYTLPAGGTYCPNGRCPAGQ